MRRLSSLIIRLFVLTRLALFTTSKPPFIHSPAPQENINILRDTAHLHAQLRNFDSLVDIRHTLLRIRPNLRQNWVALAVAYHLNGCLNETKKVLEHYEVALKVRLFIYVEQGIATHRDRIFQITMLSILKYFSTIFACWKSSMRLRKPSMY